MRFPTFNQLRARAEDTASGLPDIKQAALKTAFHVLHGTNSQRKAGSGEAFWQFREYQSGDMPRSIDWRQSGKTDRIYTRQSEHQTPQSCIFWMKRNADMGFQSDNATHSKHETAAILSLTLALLYARNGEMVGYGDMQRAGHSEKTLAAFERILCKANRAPLPAAMNVPKHAAFIGVSDFLESPEDIEAAFAPIVARTNNGTLIQTLDPAEIDLPYSGRVMFEGMENTRDQYLVNNAVDIRNEYKARIAAQMDAIRGLCAKWGWRYVLHRTDGSLVDTVKSIWLREA